MAGKIEVIVCDGLDKIPPCDVIVIAGMGGAGICGILRGGERIARRAGSIILQPMTRVHELRRFLYANNWEIVSETLAKEERKLYNIMVVRHRTAPLPADEIYYHIGEKLLESGSEYLGEYLTGKINALDTAIHGMRKGGGGDELERAAALRGEYARLLEGV